MGFTVGNFLPCLGEHRTVNSNYNLKCFYYLLKFVEKVLQVAVLFLQEQENSDSKHPSSPAVGGKPKVAQTLSPSATFPPLRITKGPQIFHQALNPVSSSSTLRSRSLSWACHCSYHLVMQKNVH